MTTLLPALPSIEPLNYDGQPLYFTKRDGLWWIAIKPVCVLLGVQPKHQNVVLKEHRIFKHAVAELPVRIPYRWNPAGGQGVREHIPLVPAKPILKIQRMLCISEQMFYGWVGQIRTESPLAMEAQARIYALFWDRFHGRGAARTKVLNTIAHLRGREAALLRQLGSEPAWNELQLVRLEIGRALRAKEKIDGTVITEQLALFAYEATHG